VNEVDISKLDFIRVNLQVDNLITILKLIERSDLVRTIEMVPEEQKDSFNFRILHHVLKFIDNVDKEVLESLTDGQLDG
jgi:hypothetical protein